MGIAESNMERIVHQWTDWYLEEHINANGVCSSPTCCSMEVGLLATEGDELYSFVIVVSFGATEPGAKVVSVE
jgi:hypothetical protein